MRTLILIALLIAAAQAHGLGLKGVNLGDSLSDTKRKVTVTCPDTGVPGRAMCLQGSTVASKKASIAYFFWKGELQVIRAQFEPEHYGVIKAALTTKYGTSITGGLWILNDGMILINERDEDGLGSLMISVNNFMQLADEILEASGNADDL